EEQQAAQTAQDQHGGPATHPGHPQPPCCPRGDSVAAPRTVLPISADKLLFNTKFSESSASLVDLCRLRLGLAPPKPHAAHPGPTRSNPPPRTPARTSPPPHGSSPCPAECSPPGPAPGSRAPPCPAPSSPVAARRAASRSSGRRCSSGRRRPAC